MIDVNNFKSVNDSYGHDAGDTVLQSIARTLLSCVRKTDTVIRYGGDEFLILFYRIPAEVFENKLEGIRHSIAVLAMDDHPGIHVSVSIGGAYGMGKTADLFKAC